jgi:hypothetical protein
MTYFLPENIKNHFHPQKRRIKSFDDWTITFTFIREAILYLFNHRHFKLDMHFERISELCRRLFADFFFLMSKNIMTVQSTMTDKTIREHNQLCLNYNGRSKRCKLKKCPRLHICSIYFNSVKVQRRHPAAFCPSWRNQRRGHQSKLVFSFHTLSTLSQLHVPSSYSLWVINWQYHQLQLHKKTILKVMNKFYALETKNKSDTYCIFSARLSFR